MQEMNQAYPKEYFQEALREYSCILRDAWDGVMVLDSRGVIKYLNPNGQKLLGVQGNVIGKKYALILFGDEFKIKENKDFHQFLLDAVSSREENRKKNIIYTRMDGSRLDFYMATSFLLDEKNSMQERVVIRFSDVTELMRQQKKYKEAANIFAAALIFLCIWIFTYILWEGLKRPVSDKVMELLAPAGSIAMFWYIRRKTDFSFEDMGLGAGRLKEVMHAGSIITLIGLFLVTDVKLVIMIFSPGYFDKDVPFWNWGIMDWSYWVYPVTVVLQEFWVQGVIHGSLRRILTGKNSEWMAIIASSLCFGILYIHKGLVYMVVLAVLFMVPGMLYSRQGTIWGACIPHFALGLALGLLGISF